MLTLLATGGTIACTPGRNGLEPTLGAADLLRALGPAAPSPVRACDVFTLDSSNVQPEEWRALARAAHEALKTSDGVVITHGTDTMPETARFLLERPDQIGQRTIVLTGAMQPSAMRVTDAPFNVGAAVTAAQLLPAGVYVCMSGRIFDGATVRKDRQRGIFL